jgi:predicted alpha/beta-hydrolase family hydrolase
MSSTVQPLTFAVGESERVSALLQVPPDALACYLMAHGAGAGMTHPFMASAAAELAAHRVATLRFQFPYMERGERRTDPPKVAHATIRAAVAEASRRLPAVSLFAGGKSFGGRMTSQAQALEPLSGIRGLVFLGFPLHPAGKPSIDRAAHLDDVYVPMLFLQGTKDELAELSLVESVVARLGRRATLEIFADADHSFHVLARTGRKDADVRAAIVAATLKWIDSTMRGADEPAIPGEMR